MTTLTLSESTCAELRAALGGFPEKYAELNPSITEQHIVSAVCENQGLRESRVRSECKDRNLSYARFMIWTLMIQLMGLTQHEIGRRFNRDHSSIGYGLINHRTLSANSPFYRDAFNEIKAALKATKTGG